MPMQNVEGTSECGIPGLWRVDVLFAAAAWGAPSKIQTGSLYQYRTDGGFTEDAEPSAQTGGAPYQRAENSTQIEEWNSSECSSRRFP